MSLCTELVIGTSNLDLTETSMLPLTGITLRKTTNIISKNAAHAQHRAMHMMLNLLCTTVKHTSQKTGKTRSKGRIAQVALLVRGLVLANWTLRESMHCTVARSIQ